MKIIIDSLKDVENLTIDLPQKDAINFIMGIDESFSEINFTYALLEALFEGLKQDIDKKEMKKDLNGIINKIYK